MVLCYNTFLLASSATFGDYKELQQTMHTLYSKLPVLFWTKKTQNECNYGSSGKDQACESEGNQIMF